MADLRNRQCSIQQQDAILCPFLKAAMIGGLKSLDLWITGQLFVDVHKGWRDLDPLWNWERESHGLIKK